MRVLGIILGVILLLPGACSLGFMLILSGNGRPPPELVLLWFVCILVSIGGIALIGQSVKRPRDPGA